MKMRVFLSFVLILACIVTGAAARARDEFCGVPFDAEATKIDFGKQAVKDLDGLMEFLDRMPKLTAVDMYASQLSYEEMDRLYTKYPAVFFGWTLRFGDHELRTDATAFSTLHSKNSPPHRDEDFRYLGFCKNLLALDIGHNYAKDLSFLQRLPKLKILIIALNKIQDITPVGQLKDLEYLEMFKNLVTDISPLANCKKLMDVNIGFNQVTDLSPIFDLPKLERLWVLKCDNRDSNTIVTPEFIAKFKQAYPKGSLNTNAYPTLGGWRDHKRYFVLSAIFQMGFYQPWDSGNASETGSLFYPTIDISVVYQGG